MRKVAASLFAIALSGCFSVPVAQQAMRFDSPGISSPGSLTFIAGIQIFASKFARRFVSRGKAFSPSA